MARVIPSVGILFAGLYIASTVIVLWKHQRVTSPGNSSGEFVSNKNSFRIHSAARERLRTNHTAAAPNPSHSASLGIPPPASSPEVSSTPQGMNPSPGTVSYGSSFFPQRGTEEFDRHCNWTTAARQSANCTILARPKPEGNEGISLWSVQIVKGYVLARQAGCRLVLDYGPGVDVRQVVQPLVSQEEWSKSDEGAYDWTTQPDFKCNKAERCYSGGMRYMDKGLRIDGKFHWGAPEYRFSYHPPGKSSCKHCLYPDSHPELRAALPGYELETGFACAYANLFRLAPTAIDFEPRLFTDILPAVRDPSTLVVAAYIRSQQADIVATREEKLKKGEEVPARYQKDKDYRNSAEKLLKCVMTLEKQHLSGKIDLHKKEISRVVWVILTDNPMLKDWAVQKYNGKLTGIGLNKRKRTVLVTRARGVHTRTRRNPTTADFAEGLLDWLLIGESDFVVFNGNSFGLTAGLRTARPIYSYPDRCSRQVLIHPENSTFRN